jgi:pimeloyl-ACP methyl ester carboxylesterase
MEASSHRIPAQLRAPATWPSNFDVMKRCIRRASHIPGAGLLIQPKVSHFSFLQDPGQFNDDVLHFLAHVPAR